MKQESRGTSWLPLTVALAAFVCTWIAPTRATSPPFWDGAEPRLSSLIPRQSVAATEGALATIHNPAALDARTESDFVYIRTLSGDYQKDDAFFLGWKGLGVGLEYASAEYGGETIPVRKTTVSGGSHIGRGLYWGTSRSWYAADEDNPYDDLSSWDLGVLYRKRWLSVGGVARQVNRPKFGDLRIERAFDFGVAIRPKTNRATLWFDFRKSDDESFPDAWRAKRYAFGMELEPINGFRVGATAYGHGQFDISGKVSVSQFGLGSYQRLDHGEDGGNATYLNIHEGQTRNAVRNPYYSLIVTPDQWTNAYWRVRRDDSIRGVIVKLDGEKRSLAAWEEMRDQLIELQGKGVKTATYIKNTGTGGYWVASATDTILVDPIAEIRLIGLRSETAYYKDLMDKVGVGGQFVRAGEYKSGIEPYTRMEPSEPASENTARLLDDFYGRIVRDIAGGRGVSESTVREQIDHGPYLGEAAKIAALVDHVAMPAEAESLLATTFADSTLITIADYVRQTERPIEWEGPGDTFALIRLDGMMVDGDSTYEPLTGTRLTGADTINRAIREAAYDSRVKAIILDIDSGGGLVTSSESIWRTVQEAKQLKPVLARIGGIGASGAYYVAAGTDHVVASPSSVTGSIGVFGGHVSLRGLYDKLGVAHVADQRGENAGFFSQTNDLDERQIAVLQSHIDAYYDLFLERVAEGRGLTVAEADERAQGQVWTGQQAFEQRLVDELGGMRETVARAKEMAGIPQERLVRVDILPKQTFLEKLISRGLDAVGAFPNPISAWQTQRALAERLADARPFAWAPFSIEN